MVLEDLDQRRADHFRYWTLHSELDDAGQVASSQGEDACKVQILSDNNCMAFACIIEYDLIRIPNISDVLPVGGGDSEWREIFSPAWRKVLVEDQIHAAIS